MKVDLFYYQAFNGLNSIPASWVSSTISSKIHLPSRTDLAVIAKLSIEATQHDFLSWLLHCLEEKMNLSLDSN